MHSKWRYNIRLSERKGVVIHRYLGNDINLSEKIDKFYELTKITNARDGNASHSKAYYADLSFGIFIINFTIIIFVTMYFLCLFNEIIYIVS